MHPRHASVCGRCRRNCHDAQMTSRADTWTLAAGLAGGVVADELLGDPAHGHPVALFGRAARAVESSVYARRKARGAGFAVFGIALATAPALAASRLCRDRPAARMGLTTACTWTVVGARSLRTEAERIRRALVADDLDAARRMLPSLCGRDPARLDTAGMARAVVESIAENSSDAIVAPLIWGALAGNARPDRLPRCQHTRRYGRPSFPSVRGIRLGMRAPRRRGELGASPAYRPAGSGMCSGRRRATGHRVADRAESRA